VSLGLALAKLGEDDLRALAAGIRTGRICPPFDISSVQRITGSGMAGPATAALQLLSGKGCTAEALASFIDMIGDTTRFRPAVEQSVQLVMTGPESSGAYHRDTGVVVGDLFRRAKTSVLVAGYAVYQGKQVFVELGRRMEEVPNLHVRLFLNLTPKLGEASSTAAMVCRFVERFKNLHWPENCRLPELYYDRRSLLAAIDAPVALHAKCVVVDQRELFVSSANFTEAAQNRNIEAGVLVSSSVLAGQAVEFFEEMIRQGVCLRAA